MKVILNSYSILVLLFLSVTTGISFAEDKAVEETSDVIYRLEMDRVQLLQTTRQLMNAAEEERRLQALRLRNRLKTDVWDLEADFSKEKFADLADQAQWVGLAFKTDINRLAGYFRLCGIIIQKAALEPQTEMLKLKYKVAAKQGIDQADVFRQILLERISVAYLRSLINPDPDKAMSDFQAYANSLRKLQEAEQFVMESEKIMLEAEQQLARDIAGSVPLLGEAIDLIGVATGEDAFTGEKLSGTQRALDALLVLAPEALEHLLANPAACKKLKDLSGKLAGMSAKGAKRLAVMLKKTPEQIAALKKKLQTAFNKKYNSLIADKLNDARKNGLLDNSKKKLDDMTKGVIDSFAKNADNLELNKIWAAAEKAGREKVDSLNRLLTNSDDAADDVLEAYQAIRKDKKALKHLQGDEFKELRTKMQKIENSILEKVDTEAISDIQKGLKKGVPDDELARISAKPLDELTDADILKLKTAQARKKIQSQFKKYGHDNGLSGKELDEMLDFDNLEITVFNATNKAPRPDKIGFDRDITCQVVIPERIVNGKKIPATRIDVPADLVEEHYHKALYKKLNPGKPVPDRKALKKFGENIDHQVTDGFHADAYRMKMDDIHVPKDKVTDKLIKELKEKGASFSTDETGNLVIKKGVDNISDFFKDPAMLVKHAQGRIEDFAETVTYKSREWFERAARATDKAKAMTDVEEGMRQATKQYDNYMTRIMEHYGLDPATALPDKLRGGMEVFKRVKDGQLTVPEAEAVLKALGTTRDQVVKQFGDKFEEIIKLGARKETIRSAKKAVK